jgi:HSP20 family molecular chaperone IbpA
VARVVSHSDGRQVRVRIELAGIDPVADVRLEVRDGVLAIEVHHSDNGRTEHVTHRVSLPEGVTADDLRTTVADDVLEIRADAP